MDWVGIGCLDGHLNANSLYLLSVRELPAVCIWSGKKNYTSSKELLHMGEFSTCAPQNLKTSVFLDL